MFNPMIQQYADAFKTQMDYDMNKARQNGLLNLQSYQPAPVQQVSPFLEPQGFTSVNDMYGALGMGIKGLRGMK